MYVDLQIYLIFMPVHSSLKGLPALSNSEVLVLLAFPSLGKNTLTLTGLPFVSLVFRTLNLILKRVLWTGK